MDFVASRAAEKQFGWRNRMSQFLQGLGVTVFDPWFKPEVRGLHEYGREDVKSGERIRQACQIVQRSTREHAVVVVVSALAGVTDVTVKSFAAARAGEAAELNQIVAN